MFALLASQSAVAPVVPGLHGGRPSAEVGSAPAHHSMHPYSMHGRQIILIVVIWLASGGCKPWSPQQLASSGPPVLVQPYPATGTNPAGPPGAVVGPPYLQ